jgi:hypothetical protein
MQRNCMRKRQGLSKLRKRLMIDTTSKCYSRVCDEIGYSIEKLMIEHSNGRITSDEFAEKKKALDDLYLKYLCELDTILIEDILVGHVNGDIKRAPRTLDMLQKELLERAMNETTGKSNVN